MTTEEMLKTELTTGVAIISELLKRYGKAAEQELKVAPHDARVEIVKVVDTANEFIRKHKGVAMDLRLLKNEQSSEEGVQAALKKFGM